MRFQQTPTRLAWVSVAVGLIVLALKFAAYRLTGSVALYSDALESIVNVVTAATALVALRISARPADANHPFGHHKAEYFSAVVEGVLIVLAALSILHEAYVALRAPQPIDAPLLGVAVNALATLLNGVWSWVLIRFGRRLRSPALIADGKHLLTDVLTSGGVIVGVGLVAATGWLVLDPLIAILVAINIVWMGWSLFRGSMSALMDEAPPGVVIEHIRQVIAESAGQALQAHALRTRQAGPVTFIEFHLVVPGEMRVAEAHALCDRIEASLRREIEGSMITIHVEPEGKAEPGRGFVV